MNRLTRTLLPQALAALALSIVVGLSLAQEKATVPKNAGGETLLTMIEKSGWSGVAFMVVLGAFSFLAVAIIIERLVNLTRTKIMPPAFLTQLQQLTEKKTEDSEELNQLVKQFDVPIAHVLRAAVLRAGRPITEVEKAMEDGLAREVGHLRSRIQPLLVIGKIAPLVGLLGTVVGMIMAFYTASQEGLGGKAELLAEGIYLALLTTAAGLTIAIPALLFAAYFHARIDRYVRIIDERMMDTIPCFARMEENKMVRAREAELASAAP